MAERQASDPDGTSLTVGGRDAFYSTSFDSTLYIQLDQGVLTIAAISTGDSLPALQQLGELAVPRTAQLAAPPTLAPVPSMAPIPTFESDADLEALFPESIGGEPLTVQTMTGEQMTISGGDPETTREIEELLVANGLAVSDIAVGFGSAPGMTGSITAARFPGADASEFLDVMVRSISAEGERSSIQVAGKDVIAVTTAQGTTQYVYPQGDVLWLVTAEEPELTQIFEALP